MYKFYCRSLVLITVIFVVSVIGQSLSVSGVVTDSTGASVAGAIVSIKNRSTGLERIVTTNGDGRFVFSGLKSEQYDLTVHANGFADRTIAVEDSEQELTVVIEPEPLRESVTVFSGSRQVELRESLNTAVNVVSRNEIEQKGYQTVGEVLKEVPGVQTRLGSDTGTVSAVAGEQIQGIGSRQALVMIDGFPIIAARGIKSGTINLDRQSTGKIEQIEVVQGAASALYGSDAIGGVVNLITRDADKPLAGRITLTAGSLGTLSEILDLGVKKGPYSGFFSISRDKQNEFDLTPTTFDTTGAGFHRYNLFAKQKWQFSPRFYLVGFGDLYTGRAKGRSLGEPDPTLNYSSGKQFDDTRDITQSYGLTANWAPTARTVIQARGYFSRYDEYGETSLTDGRTMPDNNLFQRFGRVDLSALQIIGERQIVQAGVEFSTDRYRGINRLSADDGVRADTGTVWAQDKISIWSWMTLTLGLRYDNHSIFGSALSPKVGLNVRASDRINLRASWGRGFRAPDLGQLYYKFYNPTNFYQVFGNPNLRPEHSGSWQAGMEYSSTKKTYRFGLNFFRNDVANLIESQTIGFVLPFPAPGALTISQAYAYIGSIGLDPAQYPILPFRLLIVYNNLSNIYTQGIEADANVNLPRGFSVSGAYTYLDARNRETGRYLPERIRHQGLIRFGYDDEKAGIHSNIRTSFYSGWNASSLSNRVLQSELASPAFQLVDIYASKSFGKGFEVYGTVENLLNNKDANVGKTDTLGQPLPIVRPDAGRMFRLGIRYSFDRK